MEITFETINSIQFDLIKQMALKAVSYIFFSDLSITLKDNTITVTIKSLALEAVCINIIIEASELNLKLTKFNYITQ